MYYGTSTTSLTVASSGSFSLTTQVGLSWVAGDKVQIWSDSAPSNWVYGAVTSYATSTLVFTASQSGGSGTFTDWKINLASGIKQQRHGLASEWVSANPILRKAEIGVAKDDLGDNSIKFKIGDGATAWSDLPYQGSTGVGVYAGTAALAAGSAVVDASWVAVDSVIVVTAQATPGVAGSTLYVDPADIVAVTSFTIKSDDATDTRSIFWMAAPPNPPPPSGKVLRADSSSADAYIWKDLGADRSELWVTFGIAFDSGALALWETVVGGNAKGSGEFAGINDAGGLGAEVVAPALNGVPGLPLNWVDYGIGGGPNPDPAPVAATWYNCELHFTGSTFVTEFYINGDLVYSHDGSGSDIARVVLFGQNFSWNEANSVAYIKNIKVGSTRGAADYLSEDFSGDLSAWTVVSDCTIVDNPY